jgi:homoserine O-succinyltransferase
MPARRVGDSRPEPLRIGLLNNMPDAAFRQTEAQFRRLIGANVELRLFSFADVPRGEPVRSDIAARYRSHHALRDADLDGLVITGCEPKADRLDDEPFFKPLSDVVDWATRCTLSTLFSCLASHAAVLHRDGIERRRLPAKCSGVFICSQTGGHPLLYGLAETAPVPHSRWNALDETRLAAHGYHVLRRSAEIGVDLFVREAESLLVFLQGHPEYDADSLAREYRRDVGRYLDGARDDYPDIPRNTFTQAGIARMQAFAEKALTFRDPSLFPAFPALASALPLHASWEAGARRLFGNWLREVAARRVTRPIRVFA